MTDFADTAWLFSSGPASRGLIRLNIAEAALLWKHAKQAKTGILEIGRRHGGSTCLLASANPDIPLTSVDLAPQMDAKCESFLQGKANLITGDSRIVSLPDKYDFAFIDGDHSYEGVKADFAHLSVSLTAGATVVFHDAVAGSYGACAGVVKFVGEAVVNQWIEVLETAESLLVARFLKCPPLRKLTIGMLTCSDFDGVWFSLQAIRLYHPEVLDEIEFLVINNGPENAHSEAVNKLKNWIKEPIRTFGLLEMGTAQRGRLFDLAETPYVLCMDSHVLLTPGSLRKLIDYFDAGKDEGNLLQGPLLYDDLRNVSTHFEPVWRDQMWGVWATDERWKGDEPFEIPAQGLGLFACRKDAWLGFPKGFRGFGGEECIVHERYRQAGKKTMCLPWLKWMHRFNRPAGVPYPLRTEDRVHNYLLGHRELGLDPAPVIAHFTPILGQARMAALMAELG